MALRSGAAQGRRGGRHRRSRRRVLVAIRVRNMNEVLTVLTVVSLIAAAGFGLVTWRTLADDRRRSAARVAALASAIDGGIPQTSHASTPVAVASMFTTAPGGSLKSRPLIKAAVV